MSTILPPISVVTPSDHGAFILITSGFGLSLILIFTIIRVFARLFINPPFDGDDLFMGISTLLGIIYSALLFSLVSKGFGKAGDLLSSTALVSVQKLTRWDIIGAIDIVTEVALFAMAILLVKDLKMSISRKGFVVLAFGLRLPTIAFAILRLQAAQMFADSDDPTFAGVFFVIWSVVEAHFSICSSNIACLKPFIAAFNTSFGGSAEINEQPRMDRSKGNSGSGTTSLKYFGQKRNSSYMLSTMNSSTKNDRSRPGTRGARGARGRNQEMGNDVDIIHEDTGSVGSGGSRQMIIQKDVSWDVHYSTPKPATSQLRGVAQ
ncbi:MAG: hypothetical protein Q9173_001362 [Seirophora scorigena]